MMRLTAGIATVGGSRRAINQDCATVQFTDGGTLVAVIADGLGAYTHSAEASAIACAVVKNRLWASPSPLDRRAIVAAVHAANVEVWQHATDRGVQLKTTLSLLVCDLRTVIIAHIGDCRVYLLRDRLVRQLTRDHSQAQAGGVLRRWLRPDAAPTTRHQLNRVVGDHPMVQVDVATLPLRAADRFLLCSDGLWGALPATDLATLLQADADDDHALARQFVQAAQAHGGTDDATAVVVSARAAT
jgi:serine/threonine protein phosphatase PrpC